MAAGTAAGRSGLASGLPLAGRVRRERHAKSRNSRRYALAKRLIDLTLAAVLLLLALPLLLAACLAIVLETPGWPLYPQWRSGLDGRPFRILKLRTMIARADQLGPALTQCADPRITGLVLCCAAGLSMSCHSSSMSWLGRCRW